MSFSGIDPAGLSDLGVTLEHRAGFIVTVADRTTLRLHRHGRGASADRIGTALTATARALEARVADFGWRIDAVLHWDAARAILHPVGVVAVSAADLAVALPPGVDARGISIGLEDVERLAAASPAEVAEYFERLSEAEAAVMAASLPEIVTDLDGAPPALRYAASDLLIGRRLAELRRRAADLRTGLRDRGSSPYMRMVLSRDLDSARGELVELEKWLAEDRQILCFDPAGDGRVVEVFGDLEDAANIGVVVPGITNDRSNFSEAEGGFRRNARNLHERAEELGIGGVATIAWLGYDTPDGADAVLRTAARAGYEDLIDFVAGMDALAGHRHIAVIGHSYGSLVTGMAAAKGLAANEVVFVGSPGTGLGNADEARLKPGGVVWAGLAYGDPIGAGVDLTEFITPEQQFRQTMRRILDSLDGEQAVRDLHHGTNPAHEDFGAVEIATDGSTGHSDYFRPDTVTLDNLLYIIAGMDADVRIVMPDEMILAPGPIGEPGEPDPVPTVGA